MPFDVDVTRLVGTYHKTGTVLMQNTLRKLCAIRDLWFENVTRRGLALASRQGKGNAGFIFDPHCTFDGFSDPVQHRGVRVIRDPRMVIVSSTRYHLDSHEKWLHKPVDALAGKTYQQHLRSLPDFRTQMRFEMGGLVPGMGSAERTIRSMVDWDEHPLAPCFLTVKLEDLMQDRGLDHFFRLFRHLGLSEGTLVTALRIALSNSMFTGSVQTADHARGQVGDTWESYYDSELLAEYRERFGDVHLRLGYP